MRNHFYYSTLHQMKQFGNVAFSIFILLISAFSIIAKDIVLSGEQDGVFEKAEYLVTKDIIVKPGTTIVFAAGSIIRFKPYTGITVEGNIRCNGTSMDPVVFTSDNDRNASPPQSNQPAPFDWNGISANLTADTISFTNTRIAFSTFGISVAAPSSHTTLDTMMFVKNGRTDLTVAGKEIAIKDNAAFSYVFQQPKPAKDTTVAAANPVRSAPPPASADKPFPWKLTFRIGSGIGAVACLGWGLYENSQSDRYFSLSQDKNQGLRADEYLQKSQDADGRRTIAYVCAAACAALCSVTFFF